MKLNFKAAKDITTVRFWLEVFAMASVLAIVGGIAGLLIGSLLTANSDIEFAGVRGYEAGGVIGLTLGAMFGSFFGGFIVIALRKLLTAWPLVLQWSLTGYLLVNILQYIKADDTIKFVSLLLIPICTAVGATLYRRRA